MVEDEEEEAGVERDDGCPLRFASEISSRISTSSSSSLCSLSSLSLLLMLLLSCFDSSRLGSVCAKVSEGEDEDEDEDEDDEGKVPAMLGMSSDEDR
jgi:hypothetical protein